MFVRKKKYILFDLDGTLTDSQEGIINSIIYALNAYQIPIPDAKQLQLWLGPPLKDSMMKYCGMQEAQALAGVDKFREYFDQKGIFENKVYAGVEAMAARLQQQGCQLMIATSKPETAARRIMKHFDLDSYFAYIGGATTDDSRTDKGDVIRYVLEINGITDLDEVLMIGDRKYDVAGAKENGIEVLGVLYGYGTREELEQAGADYIAATTEDILNYL